MLDFTVMCSIVNLLAAIVVILNSIGLEIHSRMCSFNLEQDPESWGKYCGTFLFSPSSHFLCICFGSIRNV